MFNHRLTRQFIVALGFLLMAAVAAGAADIQARMKARLPTITQLKAQGLIGENNRGLLEYRTEKQPQAQVVNQENADRMQVYQSIAQKQGANATLVGQHRAAQISQQAPKGTWLQDAKGKWYRK